MKRFLDLRFLFTIVAVLELVYAAAGVLTPPGLVQSVTGWVLTADGQWVAKLLGVALAAQAWVAWTFRDQPHAGVARALALYQIGSATADWVMWLVLADQGIFSTPLGKVTVVASILLHYTLGLLLVLAIRTRRSAGDAIPAHL
jgi:predicted membrane protein